MTDISNWAEMVHIMKVPSRSWMTGKEDGYFIERIMIPINGYQMGNLIDAIAQVPDTGDWWMEICAIIARAMKVANIEKIISNRGNTFTQEQVANGDIRHAKPTQ